MTGYRNRSNPQIKAFIREQTSTYVTFAFGIAPPYSVCTVTADNFALWYVKTRLTEPMLDEAARDALE